MYSFVRYLSASSQWFASRRSRTICSTTCLFAWSFGSGLVNNDSGSAAPVTGAWALAGATAKTPRKTPSNAVFSLMKSLRLLPAHSLLDMCDSEATAERAELAERNFSAFYASSAVPSHREIQIDDVRSRRNLGAR